ncbi:MAG: hypothetical protein NVS3B16_21980 [Vulcanimicrobiaceae bacterium]
MHQIFTITAEIAPSRGSALTQYLKHHRPPFEKLTKLHFASFVIVPALDASCRAYLVFENNIDGTIEAHIAELCAIAGHELHDVYLHCFGYGDGPYDAAHLRTYLSEHVLRPNTAFVGNVGRNLARIRNERALVKFLECEVDALLGTRPFWPPQALYDAIRARVAETNNWALQPKERLSAAERSRRRRRVAMLIPIARELWGPLILALIVLRAHEIADPNVAVPAPSPALMKRLRENTHGQNHFASVAVVKPGPFRRWLLRAVLLVVDRFAANSVDGTLSGLDNIHFAHWVLLDRGRRLLFLTNYDGSWENYLDDFIDKASPGLTAIWSNARSFPKSWFLVFGGARDERNFKNIARQTQIPAAAWYSAYPHLSVPSIDNNSAIREGLATPPRGAAVDAWLQRL